MNAHTKLARITATLLLALPALALHADTRLVYELVVADPPEPTSSERPAARLRPGLFSVTFSERAARVEQPGGAVLLFDFARGVVRRLDPSTQTYTEQSRGAFQDPSRLLPEEVRDRVSVKVGAKLAPGAEGPAIAGLPGRLFELQSTAKIEPRGGGFPGGGFPRGGARGGGFPGGGFPPGGYPGGGGFPGGGGAGGGGRPTTPPEFRVEGTIAATGLGSLTSATSDIVLPVYSILLGPFPSLKAITDQTVRAKVVPTRMELRLDLPGAERQDPIEVRLVLRSVETVEAEDSLYALPADWRRVEVPRPQMPRRG